MEEVRGEIQQLAEPQRPFPKSTALQEPRLGTQVSKELQRARGAANIGVAGDGGSTRLRRLFQDGCAKMRLPRAGQVAGLEAVLINTAGGLTGGDRLSWSADAGAGSTLTLTTQACERLYRASDGQAEVRTRLCAGPAAVIEWLPQETIFFNGARLDRRLEVDLAEDARLLAVEAMVLGRTAMGERVRHGALRERWRVRRAGRLVFAEELRLAGDIEGRGAGPATLAGACAFATVLLVAEGAERRLAAVRAALGAAGGASAFEGKLVARVVATNGLELRRALMPALEVLREARLPRVWRI